MDNSARKIAYEYILLGIDYAWDLADKEQKGSNAQEIKERILDTKGYYERLLDGIEDREKIRG